MRTAGASLSSLRRVRHSNNHAGRSSTHTAGRAVGSLCPTPPLAAHNDCGCDDRAHPDLTAVLLVPLPCTVGVGIGVVGVMRVQVVGRRPLVGAIVAGLPLADRLKAPRAEAVSRLLTEPMPPSHRALAPVTRSSGPTVHPSARKARSRGISPTKPSSYALWLASHYAGTVGCRRYARTWAATTWSSQTRTILISTRPQHSCTTHTRTLGKSVSQRDPLGTKKPLTWRFR